MGRRGPKPADRKLKLLKGERADRLSPGSTPAPYGLPSAPDWLDDTARAEWDRLLPELADAGVLARVDGAALTLYCVAYSRWRVANEDIQINGILTETGLGGFKKSPAVEVAQQAEAQMARLLAEFGATPAGRGRVKVPEKPPEDPLAAFLNKRKA